MRALLRKQIGVVVRNRHNHDLKLNRISRLLTGPSPPDEAAEAAIDAGSSNRKPISIWPGMHHSPVTNALWEARSNISETQSPPPPESAPTLRHKTPSESRTRVVYSFSSDPALREQYRNPWNEFRVGKLLEDLDALAGTVAFKHCSHPHPHGGGGGGGSTIGPLLLVTASVDRMRLARPISVDADLSLVGAVTWVGRSSIDIRLQVFQPPGSAPALTADFTFVARDSNSGKSAAVNRVSPETEEERALWEEAEERKNRRRRESGKKLGGEEWKELEERLRALLGEGRVFCDMPALADRDSILMRDTCLQNSFVCQPQQRNIHGRIFGGFLMRRAFELAFSTSYCFAGAAPQFLEVDHVDFFKPVDVGNFLRLKACVLYTQLENPTQPLINVEVVAHVTRPELRSSEVSNKFYFTFTVSPEAVKDGLRVRSVVPATEEEARRVLERMDAENCQISNL